MVVNYLPLKENYTNKYNIDDLNNPEKDLITLDNIAIYLGKTSSINYNLKDGYNQTMLDGNKVYGFFMSVEYYNNIKTIIDSLGIKLFGNNYNSGIPTLYFTTNGTSITAQYINKLNIEINKLFNKANDLLYPNGNYICGNFSCGDEADNII